MTSFTRDEILNKIKDVLVDDFECDRNRLTEDVNLFSDLDLDSIDAVDLIVRVQEFINKKVDPNSFKQIRTLGDVVNVIEKLSSDDK